MYMYIQYSHDYALTASQSNINNLKRTIYQTESHYRGIWLAETRHNNKLRNINVPLQIHPQLHLVSTLAFLLTGHGNTCIV